MKTQNETTRFTPGPWRLSTAEENSDGRTVRGPDSEIIAQTKRGFLRDDDRAKANAALIASAPEMLAALELLMRAESMQKGARDGCTMGEISQAIDAARAAIAKARATEGTK